MYPSVCDLVSAVCQISAYLVIVIYKRLISMISNLEFCECWLSDCHIFLVSVNEFIPILSILLGLFR